MIDSKTDDRVRNRLLDIPKRIMLSPYHGALVAGERSARYVRSLGVAAEHIASHYNTLDIASLRVLTAGMAASKFSARPFLIVARLIPEKNLSVALEAYSRYRKSGGKRRLSVIGEGPEGDRLQAQARRLSISDAIEWCGSRSRAEVAASMRQALALLLPSMSETYGLVVIEALAQGLPVIVSTRAGVVDLPVTNGNGAVLIDPQNVAGIEQAMRELDCGEAEWKVWSDAASAAAGKADARHFAASVVQLAGLEQH
ncbi:glycosyltransferase [Altererythrobacter sp. MF3-039]|uniref:glycosyltransferase n=1 Tax=Altererythrobacter sp. MF3-039 TaxID=3252901 RepID=UPI00390CAAC9